MGGKQHHIKNSCHYNEEFYIFRAKSQRQQTFALPNGVFKSRDLSLHATLYTGWICKLGGGLARPVAGGKSLQGGNHKSLSGGGNRS